MRNSNTIVGKPDSTGLRLKAVVVPDWPKLTWVASIHDDTDIVVRCGPMVEITDDWIVEAVWAGDFADGDFDRTDLVFGTGIRRRGARVDFVSSGTVFDRLWQTVHVDTIYISNSLPALLAVAEISLCDDYPHYARDVRSVMKGLEGRVKSIPTRSVDVGVVYYNNLRFEHGELAEVPKPDRAPEFRSFQNYSTFLVDNAGALRDNLSSPMRRHKVATLCSLSSGYDSSATAAVARHGGCTEAVTIKDSTSFWRGSDSGTPIAKALGFSCEEYPRTARKYPAEEAVWAACAWSGMLNWTLFDFPDPLCLFFTGCHGEKMWDRVDHDHPDPFVRRDVASLGFSEFRLLRGVWQCPVPFWGVRHSHELKAITLSDEMRPWYTGKDYDKPVARRIAEEAGVPRSAFGQTKKNSVLSDSFPWPRSPAAQASFNQFLQERGRHSVPRWLAELFRHAASLEGLLHRNVFDKIGVKKRFRPWLWFAGSSEIFCWANAELKNRLSNGLRRSNQATIAAISSAAEN